MLIMEDDVLIPADVLQRRVARHGRWQLKTGPPPAVCLGS